MSAELAAQQITRHIGCYAQQPSPKHTIPLRGFDVLVQPDKYLLDDILSQGLVGRERYGIAKHESVMGCERFLKAQLLSGSGFAELLQVPVAQADVSSVHQCCLTLEHRSSLVCDRIC